MSVYEFEMEMCCDMQAHLASRVCRAWTDTLHCLLQFPSVLLCLPLSHHCRDILSIPVLDVDYRCHDDRAIHWD